MSWSDNGFKNGDLIKRLQKCNELYSKILLEIAKKDIEKIQNIANIKNREIDNALEKLKDHNPNNQ